MNNDEKYNYQKYNQNWKFKYIVCAAIWYQSKDVYAHQPKNVQNGIVSCGLRHCNCFSILFTMFPDRCYLNNHIDGFLTSDNLFVTRKEAGEIAFKSGQIKNLTDCLFSEDIY